ncbi:MAG TPA: hypothetical protein VG028_18845 [Terriglobia bacterium]|nr:hypothetical protein [Terriglobia bacterium]
MRKVSQNWVGVPAWIRTLLPLAALALLCPAPSRAQGARDALSSFPADTQQMVYSNLSDLRALPDYSRVRQWIFTPQLRRFEEFLRSMGTDPEKDVDEVTLGWRGDPATSSYFGLAEGRLNPDRVHDAAVQQKVPIEQYNGYDLFSFNSNGSRDDIFFAFFDTSSAAFGRLSDLKALLDVRAGSRPALNSVTEFANGESELEGAAPQWGIARGSAAANQAAPWLTGGATIPGGTKAFISSVQWILYRFDWGGGFSMHMSVLCKDSKSATDLANVLTLVRAARPSTSASSAPATQALFQGMNIQANESRVEVSASVPINLADRFFGNSGTLPAP